MKNPRSTVSIKLARKLADAGLPEGLCSERTDNWKYEPTPTLTDLLERILPKPTEANDEIIYINNGNGFWIVGYVAGGYKQEECQHKYLVKAAGEMALQLLEHGFLKFDKRGRRMK